MKTYAHTAAGEEHENTVFELFSQLRTLEELIEIASDMLGQDVYVQNVNDAAYADIMRGTVPGFLVERCVIKLPWKNAITSIICDIA